MAMFAWTHLRCRLAAPGAFRRGIATALALLGASLLGAARGDAQGTAAGVA